MASASANLTLAVEHLQAGRLHDAERICRQVLQVSPSSADAAAAWNYLGLIALQAGRLADAEHDFLAAIGLKPDVAAFHVNLGNALQGQGKLQEAVESFQRCIQLKPDHAIAHSNLGNSLLAQGRLDEAVASVQRALHFKPDYLKARYNLGLMLRVQGRLDEAVDCFRKVLQLQPNLAEAHNELGALLKIQRKLSAAANSLQRAVQLDPQFADAHQNLALVQKNQGQLEAAIASFQTALKLRPDNPGGLGQLVFLQQNVCSWENGEALSQQLIDSVANQQRLGLGDYCSAFGFLSVHLPTTPAQQFQCARDWSKTKTLPNAATRINVRPASRRPGDSKLTIGYLSGDFHSHPVAFLTAELFEQHDRERFVIRGYSYGPDDGSPIRQRIARGVDQFVDLQAASFVEAAERIAADGVDILVDLTGYTQKARTQILSLRPASIQVNYLGYPGTMGAAFIDYILVDGFIVPRDQQPFFAERLVHLPNSYQVNDSRREIASHIPSRAECGLPEQGFVFCSFNNNFKITPRMFDVWMDLLRAKAGSVLWLLGGNHQATVNLQREAELRGVAAERLVFAPRVPLPEHLARHHLADLYLDTFPYTGHTTTNDLLWMGCPVVTMIGETFASRVAGSLLQTMDLPELITHSYDEYRELALRLSLDEDALQEVRRRVAANRATSPLFDCQRFARNVERAYSTMWAMHAAGEVPRAFAVEE